MKSYTTQGQREFEEEIRNYILDTIDEYEDTEGSEIHFELFNRDYYCIGTYVCKKALENIGVFEVIGAIQEYEKFHFGECNTPLDEPERIYNMYAYIIGEEVLQESKTLTGEAWEKPIKEYLKEIIEEIK